MCWSAEASLAMVGLGGLAAGVAAWRGEPRAIWGTLGYFTVMEALQATGYLIIDECGTPANRAVTLASYLHIALQPLVINAFAMAIAPAPVSAALRKWVYGLSAAASALILAQLLPLPALGRCAPGDVMCGAVTCLVSGEWHIGWELPLNNLYGPIESVLGMRLQFPAYMFAVFVLPLVYGCWRFVAFHLVAGPLLAWQLTSHPAEMPAVWCLFSIGILLIGLSPFIRTRVMGAHRPAAA